MLAFMTCGQIEQLEFPGTADGSFGGLDVRGAEAISVLAAVRFFVPHRGVVIWSLIEKRLPSPQLN